MTQSVDLVEAVVKYPARNPIDTQYGERINVVVTTPEGEQIKLWGKPGEEIANLKKGQKVVLARDGGLAAAAAHAERKDAAAWVGARGLHRAGMSGNPLISLNQQAKNRSLI